ncbi:MAG TPA: methyl-accepting chemotaxis protein, partial [Desulfobacteria bacterium]|nr:methyl-accepting chemotaxis protein [Desulfobacteria bacterium]
MKIKIAYKICAAFTFVFWSMVMVAVLAYLKFNEFGNDVFNSSSLDANQLKELFDNSMSSLVTQMSIIVLVVLAVSLFFAVYLIRNVNKPVNTYRNLMKEIASGNMTTRADDLEIVKTGDELEDLGISLMEMYRNIRSFLYNIFSATDKMVEASDKVNANAETNLRSIEQVTTAIQQVAVGSHEQAQDLQ